MPEVQKNEYVDHQRERLTRYMEESGVNQSQAARSLDISKTTLSLFLSGTYTGNNQELAAKAEQYINIQMAKQAVAKAPDFCPSVQNTHNILNMVKIVHVYGDILLIFGPAGCGKSTALKHYAQHNNGVVYLEANVTTNSPRCILKMILKALGEDVKGTSDDMMQRIIEVVADTNTLLIIDEAQQLTEKSFDALRAINDKAHIGIVYSGNPGILKRMYGRQEEEFDQLYSRIVYRVELQNNFTLEDISQMYAGSDFSEDCLRALCQISRHKGGLRVMVNQCKTAQNVAAAFHQDFSLEHLNEAASRMGIGRTM